MGGSTPMESISEYGFKMPLSTPYGGDEYESEASNPMRKVSLQQASSMDSNHSAAAPHEAFSMKQAKQSRLSLQHQVTLAISHSHLDEVDEDIDDNMNAGVKEIDDDEDEDEGFKETICDIDMNEEQEEEEEEDIDIYMNAAAPSIANNLAIGKTIQSISQIKLQQKTISFSPDPNVFGHSRDMNADDENSIYGEDNVSIMSPGALDHDIYKKPTLRTEGANAYTQIEECLKL